MENKTYQIGDRVNFDFTTFPRCKHYLLAAEIVEVE